MKSKMESQRGTVEKYGGTSLLNAERDNAALDHIVSTRRRLGSESYALLVCSGVGKKNNTPDGRKATDHAIDIAAGRNREHEWRVLEDILRSNVHDHGLPAGVADGPIQEVQRILESGTIDEAAKAKIIWLPERCKQWVLFTKAQRTYPDLQFVLLDYEDNGMIGINNGSFNGVPVDHKATLQKITHIAKAKELKGKIAIMGGFGGIRAGTKELVTLERGMSDGTATYWGAALYLDEIDIFSDQNGILPVDPGIIPGLDPIAELTYREAEAFAGLGADIIKDVAIRPARERGIPVWIKNSLDFSQRGTLVHANPSTDHYGVKAIAHVDGYMLMTVYGMRMNERGQAARVSALFAKQGFNIDSEVDGDSCRTYAFKPEGNLSALLAQLDQNEHRATATTMMTRIALVGEGMSFVRNGGKKAEEILRETLNSRKIPISMYSGAHDAVICSAFIPQEYTHQAITHLYRALEFHRSS